MQAVFIHYLGDALSSLCVLIAGLLMVSFLLPSPHPSSSLLTSFSALFPLYSLGYLS